MNPKIPKQIEKQIAANIEEAYGLLTLIKPLVKRAGTLTVAEHSMMVETMWKASRLLSDAQSIQWKAEEEAEKTAKMVRPNGDLSCEN